ncbi:hypothetical protein CerSpe_132220 [Prunus speciosa]
MPIRKVSRNTRLKWTQVGFAIFQATFTYYRLSRNLLLSLPRHFSRHKITMAMMRIRRAIQAVISTTTTSRWSDELPEEIMKLILQRLCLPDYIRCGAVCRSWRAALPVKRCPPAPQLEVPWLMLRSHPFSLKDHYFLSLSDNKTHKSSSFGSNDYISRRDCVGSIEGWLIMVDSEFWRPEGFLYPWSFCLHALQDYHLKYPYTTLNFFLNPISGVRVTLPSQSTIPYMYGTRPFFFKKVVASSVPLLTKSSWSESDDHLHRHQIINSSCLVAGLCGEGLYLAFCRPTDKSWTLIKPVVEGRSFTALDIEIIDGKLYASNLDAAQYLIVYNLQMLHAEGHANAGPPGNKYSGPPQKLVMLHPRPVRSLSSNTTDGVMYFTKQEGPRLAKDPTTKELLMIFHNNSFAYEKDPIIPQSLLGHNYVIPPQTKGFRVFKLECNNNGPQWVEVEDLGGDRILFLSKASNKLISATSLSLSYGDYKKRVEGNCICFAFDNPCLASQWMGRDFGVFSLTNKNIQRFIVPNDHPRTSLFNTQTVWFTPYLE